MCSSRARVIFRTTLLILLIACGPGQVEVAAAWPGADKDPHPCLYVTAQDVARARARLSEAELAAYSRMKFVDHFDGTGKPDELVFAALVAGNTNAEKAIVKVAFQALDKLIAAMPATIEKGVGPLSLIHI